VVDCRVTLADGYGERDAARPRPLKWCKTRGPIPLIRV
jgi:hypothetical protein